MSYLFGFSHKAAQFMSYLIEEYNRRTNIMRRFPNEVLTVNNSLGSILYLSLCMRKPTIWVPTRYYTNRAVQSQKMVRSLKFRIYEEERLYYLVAKTKALISFAVTAKLICAFVFAYAQCWFYHAAAHLKILLIISTEPCLGKTCSFA